MYQKRQQEHEKAIQKMKDKMTEVNVSIEVKIRLESEAVKKAFENIEIDVEKSVANISIDKSKVVKYTRTRLFAVLKKQMFQLMEVDVSTFQRTLKEIHSIFLNYQNRLSNFHDYLRELERSRSEAYKEILREAYKKLHKISFMLPHELQEFFEKEILVSDNFL